MTCIPQVLLYCDGAECPNAELAANSDGWHATAASARQWAKEEGWKRRNGKDYCPACAPRRLPDSAPEERK